MGNVTPNPEEAKVVIASDIPYESVQPVGTTLGQVTKFKNTATQLTVSVTDIKTVVINGKPQDFIEMRISTSVTNPTAR